MTTGVLAALVQFLGLVRWPFLVPYLARADADADASPARREAIEIVFQSFHRYLGVAVGEHLGYLFTGSWSALTGIALMQATNMPSWLGLTGVVVGGLLMICSFEFVGGHEEARLAGRRGGDPDRVRRMVAVAGRCRRRPPHLTAITTRPWLLPVARCGVFDGVSTGDLPSDARNAPSGCTLKERR